MQEGSFYFTIVFIARLEKSFFIGAKRQKIQPHIVDKAELDLPKFHCYQAKNEKLHMPNPTDKHSGLVCKSHFPFAKQGRRNGTRFL